MKNNYLEKLILGTGRKARDLIGYKFSEEQASEIEKNTILTMDEVLDLSETQFEVLITRLNIK